MSALPIDHDDARDTDRPSVAPGARGAPWLDRLVWWAPVSASLLFSLIFIARSAFLVDGLVYFSLRDDAMVSMQYARNLAAGHGLVWNAGETPVEGYTNFLWVLWMALIHRLPIPENLTSLAVMATGATLLALIVPISGAIARRTAPHLPLAAPLAMWSVALYYPLTFWTLRGMEVGLVTLVVAMAMLLALRLATAWRPIDLWLLAAVMVVGLLTRTDLLVPCLVVAGWTVLAIPSRQRLTTAAVLGLVLTATLSGHLLFRLAYYGLPAPTTYYLKVTGIALSTRLERGLSALAIVGAVHLLAPLLLATLGLLAPRRRFLIPHPSSLTPRSPVWLLAAVFLGLCAYSAYVGGDAWEWMLYANRYITPGVPPLLVLAAIGLAWLLRRSDELPVAGRSLVIALALFASLLAVNGLPWRVWATDNAFRLSADALMVRYGLALRAATAPPATLAVTWAGALTYFSHRPAIDLLGKNDQVIAMTPPVINEFLPGHNKWDYAHSIGRLRPDLVAQSWFTSEADLAAIRAWGYEPLAPGVYVRADSTLIDRAKLSTALAAFAAEGHPVGEEGIAPGSRLVEREIRLPQ